MAFPGITRRTGTASPVAWYDRDFRVIESSHRVGGRVFAPSRDGAHEADGTRGTLVWLHGGSWVSGSVEQWHPVLAPIAGRLAGRLVAVRYRLAPQHPHPAAFHDLHTVVRALLVEHPGEPVVVAGDSAGATIAASVALALGADVSGQVLLYPPTDPTCDAIPDAAAAFPTRRHMLASWRAFAGVGHRSAAVPVSPLDADVPDTVAPASLVVGSADPLLPEVVALRDHLVAGGGSAGLTVLPGAGHAALLSPDPTVAQTVADLVVEAFDQHRRSSSIH